MNLSLTDYAHQSVRHVCAHSTTTHKLATHRLYVPARRSCVNGIIAHACAAYRLYTPVGKLCVREQCYSACVSYLPTMCASQVMLDVRIAETSYYVTYAIFIDQKAIVY